MKFCEINMIAIFHYIPLKALLLVISMTISGHRPLTEEKMWEKGLFPFTYSIFN